MSYIKNYKESHEVVTGENKKYLEFFPINQDFRITTRFERVRNSRWFSMETSGTTRQVYRVYGIIHFTLHDTVLQLNIYQSQKLMAVAEYKDHLFLPFNKAYNPYCAYVSGRYNCPLPPRENNLRVAILAGEKRYGKQSH